MDDRPAQRAEGKLIERALKACRLSQREAARRAGISEGRWRAIMHGYHNISAGVNVPVRGPADTIARMASVVGIEPEQLEDAGREDAAYELREMRRWTKNGQPASRKEREIQLIREIRERVEELSRLRDQDG